jgi:signal transduction histidine kinase
VEPTDKFLSGGPDRDAPTSLARDVDRLVHKLRTPLNSLSLNADLLRSVALPKAGKEALFARALKSLQTEVGRLDQIAGNFQRYVSIAFSPSGPTPIPVAAVLRTAIAQAGESGEPRGFSRIRLVAPEKLPPVLGDGPLLAQALIEVIHNALEASEEGTVTVEASSDGKEVFVDVSDQGRGVEYQEPEKIFELFLGGKQGHLGFGLTYARRIARVHGGELTLAKNEPGGATFRLALPAIQ